MGQSVLLAERKTVDFQEEGVTELMRYDHACEMVELGMQIPLNHVLKGRTVSRLEILNHAIERYRKRFQRKYPIEIEAMIKDSLLSTQANIVGVGEEGRIKVVSGDMMFILDSEKVYTTYHYRGFDRNNDKKDINKDIARLAKAGRRMRKRVRRAK